MSDYNFYAKIWKIIWSFKDVHNQERTTIMLIRNIHQSLLGLQTLLVKFSLRRHNGKEKEKTQKE